MCTNHLWIILGNGTYNNNVEFDSKEKISETDQNFVIGFLKIF